MEQEWSEWSEAQPPEPDQVEMFHELPKPKRLREILPDVPIPRDMNGVKMRVDGKGSDWGEAHRKVPGEALCIDFDQFHGVVEFGRNGENNFFTDYQIDGWQLPDLDCAYLCFTDRKKATWEQVQRTDGWYYQTRQVTMDICRKLAHHQSHVPRFFYVCNESAPWTIIEWHILSGEVVEVWRDITLDNQVASFWVPSGLLRQRNELGIWLRAEGRKKRYGF